MSRETVVNNQYQIEDVLHQDAYQRIYLALDLFSESKTPVYLTAFRDLETGSPIIQAFQDHEQTLKRLFDDFFLLDEIFYTVSKQCPGKPFPSFITNTMLNPYEKGLVVSNYLNKMLAMDSLPLVMKYVLSSFGNISVVDRKIVCMNNILFFSPEDLTVTKDDYLQRMGDFLLCVYGNSLYASIEEVEAGPQPEVSRIIQRCYQGVYANVAAVQKEFNPIYFKSRLRQDERPLTADGDSTAIRRSSSDRAEKESDVFMVPDHPDAPERPILLTRERKIGRRGKRAKRQRRWMAFLGVLFLAVAGIYGITRLWPEGDTNGDLTEVPMDPPAQEEPETPDVIPAEPEEPDPEQPEIDPPPVTTPEEPVETPTTYTVQSGDTLYGISQEFLGDGSRYPELMELNNITDPASLRAGQVLQLPQD